MCGIGGFSLNYNSSINARQLAHELLVELEIRGGHASGVAWADDGVPGVYKAAKTGSQLPLTELPRSAKTVIAHTRFATQGSPTDNRNNHPVISPKGDIALVHNGVIANDDEYRTRWPDLAAVDSAVIPAIIEADGIFALKEMSGYAAIAWLDATDPTATDVMHIARLDSSPVAYTWLYDGSFVWASTKAILYAALLKCNLEHGHIFDMDETEYLAVRWGVPVDNFSGLGMTDDFSAWMRYSGATSGGHASTTTVKNNRNPRGIGSSFGALSSGVWDDDVAPGEDGMTWEDDYRVRSGNVTFDPDEVAMAMGPETNTPRGAWLRNPDTGELEFTPYESCSVDLTDENRGFYISTIDGDLEHFDSLENMESHLAWLSNMTLPTDAPFPNAPSMLRWTNLITDMGDITVRNGMQSWIEDMARIDYYESPAMYNLDYLRDGLGELITMNQS